MRPTRAGATALGGILLAAVLLGSVPRLPAQAATTVGGTYHPLQPARILDTRDGTGGVPRAQLQTGGLLNVQITGQGLVPTSGVAAVVMNVTVTNTSAPSFLTVFPAGVTQPLASNLNWVPGQTVPNLVEVGVGTSGQVTVYNAAGSVDVIFDVAGYYSTSNQSPGPDGLYNPVVPARLLDTRSPGFSPLGPGGIQSVQVTGRGGIPGSGVAAVVLNVTVTAGTQPSFVTAWPSGTTRPTASNLNFAGAQTVANRVVVKLAGGKVDFYNLQGTVHLIVDVNGWFTDASVAATGSRFSATSPFRILDSRSGTGGYTDPWGPASGRALTVAGVGGVPLMTDPNPPTAVVANITVTNTTAPSFLTAWPDGAAQPLASDLNWTGGTVPNLAVVQVGPTGKIDIYNAGGCADVIVDVVGWFTGPIPITTPGPPPTAINCQKGWLGRFNYWRSTAGLPPLTENPTWSSGDVQHSQYMIKNQSITHYETPGMPYYTATGDAAARNGNLYVTSDINAPDEQSIDWWMAAPFHALGMMDPRLQSTGFGADREGPALFKAGFTLDVLRGNPGTGGTYPVYWPGNGQTVPLRTYNGNESPDPLSACPGYTVPAGLPVFLQVGSNVATSATVHTFTGSGTPLAHCIIDSNTPNVGSGLKWRGAVIVIPQQPLQPGVLYVVTLTVNNLPYTWSFQVS